MVKKSSIMVLAIFTITLSVNGAAEYNESDFGLDFDQQEYEIGEIVETRIETPEEAGEYNYFLETGTETYERTEDLVIEHRLEESVTGFDVRVLNEEGDSVTEFSEQIVIEEEDQADDGNETEEEPSTDPVEPSDEFELELIDDEFEVRELLESRLHVPDEEATYRLNYRINGQTYTTTGKVFRHRITGDEEELTVRIRDSDGEHLETLTESFDVVEEPTDQPQPEPEPEPEPEFETDVEGLEVEYTDSGAEITVPGEEFREIPEILMGESISAWHQVILQPAERSREARAGTEVELEENTDYSLPEGLATYSVVDVSGENLDVVDLSVEAEVDRSWASTNDLLVTSRHADVSFYVIRDGEWTPVESDARVRNDGIEVRTGGLSLTDGVQIGIAGDPEGLEHGSFAAGPDGNCEEIGENDPVPPGWEEIDVNCDIHEERERQQDRIIDQIDRMENRDQIESSEADEMRSEVNSLLDEYEVSEAEKIVESHEIRSDLDRMEQRVDQIERLGLEEDGSLRSQMDEVEYLVDQGSIGEAETELEQLSEDMRQHRDEMREVQQYFRQVERIEQQHAEYTGEEPTTIDGRETRTRTDRGLPEELEGELEYERSEEVQQLYDQAYDQAVQVAEGEVPEQEFEEAVEELRETKESQEDLERIRRASSTYQSLERIKEEDLNEEQQQQVEDAEELLLQEQNVEEASEIVDDLRRELELEEARNFIMEILEDEEVRDMIREIVADVMPGL